MGNRTAEQSRVYRANNIVRARAYSRKWARNNRTSANHWAATNKDKVNSSLRKWQEKNPDKVHAYQAVNDAQRRGGTLKKSPFCQLCWTVGKVEAHHYMGYAKEFRLVVIWICRSCHKFIHWKPI